MSAIASRAISGSDQALSTGGGRYFGFSFRETGGSSSATVAIYDGTSTSGTLLDTIALNAGESAREWYGPMGIQIRTGIYIDVGGSGTVAGAIRLG